MRKSYKYRANPSKRKTKILKEILRICCWLYNHLHQERITIWEQEQREVGYYEQQNLLSDLKDQYPFLKEVQSQVLQDVVRRLNIAWKPFYQKQKKIAKLEKKLLELVSKKREEKLKKMLTKTKTVNYPRKKRTDRYHSFTYTQNNNFALVKSQLKLARCQVGWISIEKHRELEGIPKTCSISVKNAKWYVVFSCEVESKPKLDSKTIPLDKQIGVDVNTSENNFYVLSNGYKCDNPQWFQQKEKELSEKTRKIDKRQHKRNKEDKTKPSKNYREARLQFAKKAEQVSNRRSDFIFKEVSKLVKGYDFFGVENFKSSKIVEKSKEKNKWYSAKRMYDSSLSSFLQKLSYKVEETGKIEKVVSPAYTSQTCSKCHERAPIKQELKDRIFICVFCGLELDRDINSAKNILRKARITEFGADFVRQIHASP